MLVKLHGLSLFVCKKVAYLSAVQLLQNVQTDSGARLLSFYLPLSPEAKPSTRRQSNFTSPVTLTVLRAVHYRRDV